jgi:hypothetical protein
VGFFVLWNGMCSMVAQSPPVKGSGVETRSGCSSVERHQCLGDACLCWCRVDPNPSEKRCTGDLENGREFHDDHAGVSAVIQGNLGA